MEIKGISIESTISFVQKKFGPEGYEKFLNALSPESRELYSGMKILSSIWYPGVIGLIEPANVICTLFYNGDVRGAWELGSFAAEIALKGILRIFLKIGSPDWVLERIPLLYKRYYRPGEVKIVEYQTNHAKMRLIDCDVKSHEWEHRMAGYIEKALIISGAKGVKIKINNSFAGGNPFLEMEGTWK